MSTKQYQLGFALSLLLTIASFGVVWLHTSSGHELITHTTLGMTILALAIVQLGVQMIFFLHIGESKARDVSILILAGSLILFIVIGSLWIMTNLAQNHGLPYHGDVTPQTSTD